MLSRSLAKSIASGVLAEPTLREVLRAAGAADVTGDDPGVTANSNTREALAAALDVSRHFDVRRTKADAK